MLLAVSVNLGQCRHQPSGDPEAEALLTELTTAALADATGACTAGSSGGVATLVVRATSQTNYTHCDLATGARVEAGAGSGAIWDIRFQRFKAGTNSGTSASGSGGAAAGGACRTGVSDFAAVTSVSAFPGVASPDCPVFAVDTELVGAGAGGGSVAFSGSTVLKDWYTYNIFTHALTARADVYIIRSSDGAEYYKLQMFDYYDAAGSAGYPAFRYARIPL